MPAWFVVTRENEEEFDRAEHELGKIDVFVDKV